MHVHDFVLQDVCRSFILKTLQSDLIVPLVSLFHINFTCDFEQKLNPDMVHCTWAGPHCYYVEVSLMRENKCKINRPTVWLSKMTNI